MSESLEEWLELPEAVEMDPSAPMVLRSERIICSFLITATTLLGVLGCLSVLYSTGGTKKLSTFNIICIVKTIINITALSAYVFMYIPLTITGVELFPILLNARVTSIWANLYNFNQMTCLILAINRFIALWLPLYYHKICTNRNTFIVFVLLVIYTLVEIIITFTKFSCLLVYSPLSMSLTITPLECWNLQGEGDYIYILFIICLAVNVPSFAKCLWILTGGCRGTFYLNDKRTKKNILLFFQTVLQDALFVIDITFINKLSALIENNNIWNFICFTYTGLLVHAGDSVIMLAFQPDLLTKRNKKETANSKSFSHTTTVI